MSPADVLALRTRIGRAPAAFGALVGVDARTARAGLACWRASSDIVCEPETTP